MCTLLWSHTQVHVHVNGLHDHVGQVVAQPQNTFLYKIIQAPNFGHKDQAVFDHRDLKKQFPLYTHKGNSLAYLDYLR